MKALFSGLIAKFDVLMLRERRLVGAALLIGVLLIGWSMLIDPALVRLRIAVRGIADQRSQFVALQAQMAVLQSPEQDPEALARAELAGLKKQLGALNEELATMESRLVPPRRMASLLEQMIGHKSGLRLVSLRTLPAALVLEKKEGAEAPAPVNKATAGLYKHGVEIKLEGGYAELTDYLVRLEKAPQKLLWSSVSLSTDKHPKLVLTLTVFTLSLDRTWLIV